MIDWSQHTHLIEELASKRAIIFIGAGISAGALSKKEPKVNPPTWKSLLKTARDKFLTTCEDKKFVTKLIAKGQLLDAAEIIFNTVSAPERHAFFSREFAIPNYEPCPLHKVIQDINTKIVITTNYDQIYEQQCGALIAGQGFKICKYTDNNLLNSIRYKDNVIIKAHGCVSQTEDIVLTRSDYFKMKRDYSQFYNILNSLLMVNTVLFLGCSMSDPDIQLVLENTTISAHSSYTHYAIMPSGTHASLSKAMEKSYNIKMIEYELDEHGGHSKLLGCLEDLSMLVAEQRPIMMG
ncbi:SIR2 family protein [Aeromonas veronii]|uniref:SIR2 family protein n=1 Tax=Aeromonas veronii TaxID=654 RepID=UPI0009571D09|nr:SIR2 family protein [Aeromonas veronii]SIQ63778.1 SIR2-like domain-containing protein [Aeromonas veronii]